jgi:hypothetical protein
MYILRKIVVNIINNIKMEVVVHDMKGTSTKDCQRYRETPSGRDIGKEQAGE